MPAAPMGCFNVQRQAGAAAAAISMAEEGGGVGGAE